MSETEKCSVSQSRVTIAYVLVVLMVTGVCYLGTMGANLAHVGWSSEVSYATPARILGLGMGLICGILWCTRMRKWLQPISGMSLTDWRKRYSRRGVRLAMLAGFLATLVAHAVLGWAYARPDLSSLSELTVVLINLLIFGVVFGLTSGGLLGLIATEIWRITFEPQVLAQLPDEETGTTPPIAPFSNDAKAAIVVALAVLVLILLMISA